MEKLTEAQFHALAYIADRDGHFSAWALGTRTCEALRTRGLVRNGSGDVPFRGGWDRSNGQVWITDAGRAALAERDGREG